MFKEKIMAEAKQVSVQPLSETQLGQENAQKNINNNGKPETFINIEGMGKMKVPHPLCEEYISGSGYRDVYINDRAHIIDIQKYSLIRLLAKANDPNDPDYKNNPEIFKKYCVSNRELFYADGYVHLINKDIFNQVIARFDIFRLYDRFYNDRFYEEMDVEHSHVYLVFPRGESRIFLESEEAWEEYVNVDRDDDNKYTSLDKIGFNGKVGLFSKLELPEEESIFD